MTVIGDILSEKLAEKANDINSFIWKGPRVNGVQEEIKLIDADYDQLVKYYRHCEEMLYNTDLKNPGRMTLLNIVQEQITKCRAELLIRWLRAEKQYPANACLEDIRNIISNNKDTLTQEVIKTYHIGNVMSGIPIEFERIPISTVMDACLDSLGIYSNDHLTFSFITKMGLWFTQQEMQKELYEKDPETGKTKNRLEVVRERLGLKADGKNPIYLKISTTGLSYEEFSLMCKLKKDKYSNLSSNVLRLLSNKVLYRFMDQCEQQAKQWQDKQRELVLVANKKGWDITRNID
jgi:hypothetical protein